MSEEHRLLHHKDKLSIARRIIVALETLDPDPQRDVLRALSVCEEHEALRRVLSILSPLSHSDSSDVLRAVAALVEPKQPDEIDSIVRDALAEMTEASR